MIEAGLYEWLKDTPIALGRSSSTEENCLLVLLTNTFITLSLKHGASSNSLCQLYYVNAIRRATQLPLKMKPGHIKPSHEAYTYKQKSTIMNKGYLCRRHLNSRCLRLSNDPYHGGETYTSLLTKDLAKCTKHK